MVLSGPKRVSRRASLTNSGCHFGSMPGIAPSVGRTSSISLAYKQGGMKCDCLGKIKFGSCAAQYAYLKEKNLLFNCKLTGGTGRQLWTKNCSSKVVV
jgi:hypothetical protein